MAKRKKNVAPEEPKTETRKQTRLRVRDQERNRRFMMIIGGVIALALILVTAGIVSEMVIKPRSVLAQVEDRPIITRDFWGRTLLRKSELENQLSQMQFFSQQFGGQNFFASQMAQIQATLSSPLSLGTQVVNLMIEEEIIRIRAEEMGITVSDEEVEALLREEVAAAQGALTVPQATATAEAQAAATATAAVASPTPLPTPVEAETEDPAAEDPEADVADPAAEEPEADVAEPAAEEPEADVADPAAEEPEADVAEPAAEEPEADVAEPAAEEPEADVAEPAAQLEALEDLLTPTPVPVLDDELYQEGLNTLSDRLRRVGLTLGDYREILRTQLLRDKLQEAIGAERVEATQEQINVRHILIRVDETAQPVEPDPEDDANEVLDDAQALAIIEDLRQRILAGEDFADLAREYSDDPGSGLEGGDLGWVGRGAFVPEFEEAAFTLPVGEVSEPVRTNFGYHLIEVVERDDSRPKDEAQLQQEQARAFQDWLQEQSLMLNIQRPTNLPSMLPSGL
jgi:parvulin-like peptidyl-prolyl isomerase